MTEREALKHLKATIEAFGPDEGIELDQKAWSKLHSAIKEALSQPNPPPECQTEAEKTAFAFGWFKAMESQRKQDPVAIHQFRSPHCSDWYDGVPDHHDGHGPYEVRTLYTTPPQPEQEPLFWFDTTQNHAVIRADVFATVPQSQRKGWGPLYTTPPQRKPLTDDEIWKDDAIMAANSGYGADFETLRQVIRAIEAAHGIKE